MCVFPRRTFAVPSAVYRPAGLWSRLVQRWWCDGERSDRQGKAPCFLSVRLEACSLDLGLVLCFVVDFVRPRAKASQSGCLSDCPIPSGLCHSRGDQGGHSGVFAVAVKIMTKKSRQHHCWVGEAKEKKKKKRELGRIKHRIARRSTWVVPHRIHSCSLPPA